MQATGALRIAQIRLASSRRLHHHFVVAQHAQRSRTQSVAVVAVLQQELWRMQKLVHCSSHSGADISFAPSTGLMIIQHAQERQTATLNA
eukprot:19905-Heterococcus_DN1.PRE.3